MKNLVIIPILLLFLISFVSASLYDDFSSEELNEDLWSDNGNMDEYYVEEGVYHTAQINGADRYVNLMMVNQEFTSGDVVEYDLDYVSGSGNRMTNIIIDNMELNRYVGLMGYWGEVQQAGNDFGIYHFRVEFIENEVNVFITKPNEETIQIIQLPQIQGEAHSFGVGTRTGHNGIVHMDFDNFVINPDEEEPEDNDFEERISDLEEQTDELNERVESLEQGQEELINRTNLLDGMIDEVSERLNNFISEFTSLLSFTPTGFRRDMICSYMRENNLNDYNALGLSCQIIRRNWVNSCICR